MLPYFKRVLSMSKKLIFGNVGVYGESMAYFQILKTHKVKELLKVKETLLRAMV